MANPFTFKREIEISDTVKIRILEVLCGVAEKTSESLIIDLIKHIRTVDNLSLRESKDVVDAVVASINNNMTQNQKYAGSLGEILRAKLKNY